MAVPTLNTSLSRVPYSGQLIALKFDLGGDETQLLLEGALKTWVHSNNVTTFSWAGHGLVQNDKVTISNPGGGLVYGRFSVLSVNGDNFTIGMPCTWVRSGTTVTVTCTWHQGYVGASFWISGSSDQSALPDGLYTVQSYISPHQFTITGINAGNTSGSCAAVRNSGTSGNGYVLRDKFLPKLGINAAPTIDCPLFVVDRQWLYIRIPDAYVLSGGETVRVYVPPAFISHSGRTDVNAEITDQILTNLTAVENLPDTPPANAAEMRLGINSAGTPYYGTLIRKVDALGMFSEEESYCLLDQVCWRGSALLGFDRATGMPSSVGSGTIWGLALYFVDDDGIQRKNYPVGLWTVRWKGTATPSLAPQSGTGWSSTPISSGQNGAWNYAIFNVTTSETGGIKIQVTGPGTITDLQVILPGYSTGGGDPTDILCADYKRILPNPPYKHWRSMGAGFQVKASRNCNIAKIDHWPPSTLKCDQAKTTYQANVVGVTSLGLNENKAAWTRSGATVTITVPYHGKSPGSTWQVLDSTDPTALPNSFLVVQSVLDEDTFTVTGYDAGATSGTCRSNYRGNVDRWFPTGLYIYEVEHDGDDIFFDGMGVLFGNYPTGDRDWAGHMCRRIDATHIRVALGATTPTTPVKSVVISPMSIYRQVELCNEMGWDLWFNVPHAMDDAGIQVLADYIAANLTHNCIVEFSNENWNAGFSQFRRCFGAGNSDPEIAPAADIYQALYQWSGKRAAQIHKIFYDRFQLAGVTSKLKRLISGQGANSYVTDHTFRGYKAYCDAYSLPFNLPDFVAYTIYFGAQLDLNTTTGPGTREERLRDFWCGGALNFSLPDPALWCDVSEVDSFNMIQIRHVPHKALVDGWNTQYTASIKMALYEAGWAFWGSGYIVGTSSSDGGVYSAEQSDLLHLKAKEGHRHPRMAEIYMQSLKDSLDYGIAEYSAFMEPARWAKGGYWGNQEYMTQVVGPGDGRSGGNNNLLNLDDGDDVEAVKSWTLIQWTADEEPPPPPPAEKRLLMWK